ncbi:hypothetical protein K8I85_07120 [bacterium]|nr:hypothetical protein [bacterium]
MSFNYQQVGGGIAGNFTSVGGLSGTPVTEGTIATTFVLDGLNYLLVLGAVEDGIEFRDAGVILVSSVAPIVPGAFTLDGTNAVFLQIDDAVGWNPPADPCAVNWSTELASIVAAGKYGSISGTLNLLSLDMGGASGTFDAVVEDPDSGIQLDVTGGEFNVVPPSAVDGASWGSTKALYR